MANKLISELAVMSDVDLNVVIEVQHPAQALTKKLTLSDLSVLFDTYSNLADRVVALETTSVGTTTDARITALETAIGNYKILSSGSWHITDISGGNGDTHPFTLTNAATDTDYIVLGSFYSVGNPNLDISQTFAVIEKNTTDFTVQVKEIFSFTQDVWFYYIAIEL